MKKTERIKTFETALHAFYFFLFILLISFLMSMAFDGFSNRSNDSEKVICFYDEKYLIEYNKTIQICMGETKEIIPKEVSRSK